MSNFRQESTMDSSDNIAAARVPIKILKSVGLWRWRQDDNTASIKSCQQRRLRQMQQFYGYLLHWPLTFTFITLMWMDAFDSRNLEEAGDVLYMSLTEAVLVVKIFNIWHFSTEAWKFVHEVETSAVFALRTLQERTMWHREQQLFGRVVYLNIGGSLGVVCSAYVGVLLAKTYELPFPYWVPFEWRNRQNYWYVFVYDVLAMTLTCISNSTLDVMYCYFAFHLALLYKLIGLRLTVLLHLKEEDALKDLYSIFKLHRSVKRLNLQCESLISAPILAQIVLSAFILCFSGYRLQNVNISEDIGRFFSMLQFVSVMILQIFLPCYFVNEITVNSGYLTNCIYSSNWLQYSTPTRKLIVLYMEFLKCPVKMKAGNFFSIGLPIFTKTINNAYSFFAILINMEK